MGMLTVVRMTTVFTETFIVFGSNKQIQQQRVNVNSYLPEHSAVVRACCCIEAFRIGLDTGVVRDGKQLVRLYPSLHGANPPPFL